ncbi:protein ORF121 [Cyprinid herpesvirus 1]|uniref:Protein ORF121 n=1 Tax=Cyprinid herpesvirus 1 TaxID=317858 RepID=K7PBY2_9VIRU|nr:protein ORF121 [Cyprinid herpesvirus 1]AFJ20413.1 protein ORF121 [Cyprinid herpesvirus 1]
MTSTAASSNETTLAFIEEPQQQQEPAKKTTKARRSRKRASSPYSLDYSKDKRDQAKKLLRHVNESADVLKSRNVTQTRAHLIKVNQVAAAFLCDSVDACQAKALVAALAKDLKCMPMEVDNSDLVCGIQAQLSLIQSLYNIADSTPTATKQQQQQQQPPPQPEEDEEMVQTHQPEPEPEKEAEKPKKKATKKKPKKKTESVDDFDTV